MLGRLFFNIHSCNLFLIIEKFDIANFADDSTPHVTGDNISSVVNILDEVAFANYQWFRENEMKANAMVIPSTKSLGTYPKQYKVT